jgi:glycosyltransferase involved in cell wall biosynthesis
VIYICIPVLDEAPTVGVLLWRIRQVMLEFRRDFHLLVLDDASSDDTRSVLEPYQRVMPLTVLRNERSGGYAAAVERLLREAADRSTHPRRDAAVVIQADFTEPPEEIPSLVKRLEGGADLVGSTAREVEGELPRGLRWSRRGLPWLLGRTAFPREAGDPFSGFRAYRVQALRRAFASTDGPLLTRQGWAANAELLLRIAPHARRTDGVPVRLRYTRRQRTTRFLAWPTLREAWELARAAPRRTRAAARSEPDEKPAEAPLRSRPPGKRKRGRREVDTPDRAVP